MMAFSAQEQRIVVALARAAIPDGEILPGGGEITLTRLQRWLKEGTELHWLGIKALLWAAELAAIPSTGRRLSKLPPDRARTFLEDWQRSQLHPRRALLRAILTPLKAAHYDDADMFERVGCSYGKTGDPVRDQRTRLKLVTIDEPVRWMQRVRDGRSIRQNLQVDCEVVVIGTGAGGAACAYELASRGRAVLLLEEGDYHRRSSFTARAAEMSRKLYRDQGLTVAVGNIGTPVWAGRAVGGSTVINSGTCYRAPGRIFDRWERELGLSEVAHDELGPYYERVERMLEVTPAKRELTGGIGRVIARGADALGYSHHPLQRNAPDCDGQGVCVFGCPTGAKRSTDVSYIPQTLLRGAELITAAEATSICIEEGRARGVRARLGSGYELRVRADAVVLAGGALMTPVLLERAGVLHGNAALGKNLSIHPATRVIAVFDEPIDMANAIPQGYAVDQFRDEGLMFEGGSTPLDVTAIGVPWVGTAFSRLMEQYRHIAQFGIMIEDSSRGTVRAVPGGAAHPFITYNMNDADCVKMARAVAILCEIFLAAGARRVLPMLPGLEEVRTGAELRRLATHAFHPGDFDVTAYHPLGTCRIGTDPRTSVLGPDHETHEIESLYVADGSAVPSALGVNPQMTIMAMSHRVAELIDARLA
ncbi:GMC family oxidoreductase [Pendulispora brunnea]|uniref:GMC family oxidoreductase n=1 Tax=Pendulispora brunnea TaxID=2905690 RepID=A0ABZ2KES8_9BACT